MGSKLRKFAGNHADRIDLNGENLILTRMAAYLNAARLLELDPVG